MKRRDFLKSTPAFAGLLMGYCSPKPTIKPQARDIKRQERDYTVKYYYEEGVDMYNYFPIAFCNDKARIVIPEEPAPEVYQQVADIIKKTIPQEMWPSELAGKELKLVHYDSNIKSLYNQNTILIGCECERLVKEFYGDLNCDEGLEEGVSRIEMKKFGDNIAMLISASTEKDFLYVAEFIANYRKKENIFEGSKIEIIRK